MNDLPSKNQIDKNLIGYYPFDKINPVKTKKNSQYIISEKSSLKPDYFILDENRNVKAKQSPKLVKGVSGKALEFSGDYDRVRIENEIPSFEWTDPFRFQCRLVYQKKENSRQFLLGTTGEKIIGGAVGILS